VQVGLVLQRSVAVLSALAIPLVILWYFVYDIYMYIGVERAVCEVIKEYVYIRAWAIPVDIVNESYEKYLMSMGVMAPAMWSNVAFNICVVGFNCLFIFGFGWGFRALAISWVLSTHVMTVVLIALSLYHPSVQRTLQPLDGRALQEWKEFIVLGLPGTIMLCSEWWAFECLMLLATFLGTPQVAAQAIILQISSIVFMVPLGIGVTCASFVGNAIGAGKVALAKQIGKLCLGYTGLLNIILGGIILLLGDQFVALFTSDPHVIYETDNAIPFLSMFVMIDGLQATASGTRCSCKIFCGNSYVLFKISMPSFHWKSSMYCLLTVCFCCFYAAGVLRGAGKQYVGAGANVFAYYAVGLPMAYLVCFRLHHGVDGLMMGIASGSLVQVFALFTMIFCFEDYLYGGAVVRKQGGFLPVSLDESAHSLNGEVEMQERDSSKEGNGSQKSVYSSLHFRHTNNVSVDVTVDDSDSEDRKHDYSV
jgi:MATE family multidrug resistance protein